MKSATLPMMPSWLWPIPWSLSLISNLFSPVSQHSLASSQPPQDYCLKHILTTPPPPYSGAAASLFLISQEHLLPRLPWHQAVSHYSSLFATNYYARLRSLTSLMQSWQFPSLSCIGHIHAVMMTILPKGLYYFHTLPVYVSSFRYCRIRSYPSFGLLSIPKQSRPLLRANWLPPPPAGPTLSPLGPVSGVSKEPVHATPCIDTLCTCI